MNLDMSQLDIFYMKMPHINPNIHQLNKVNKITMKFYCYNFRVNIFHNMSLILNLNKYLLDISYTVKSILDHCIIHKGKVYIQFNPFNLDNILESMEYRLWSLANLNMILFNILNMQNLFLEHKSPLIFFNF